MIAPEFGELNFSRGELISAIGEALNIFYPPKMVEMQNPYTLKPFVQYWRLQNPEELLYCARMGKQDPTREYRYADNDKITSLYFRRNENRNELLIDETITVRTGIKVVGARQVGYNWRLYQQTYFMPHVEFIDHFQGSPNKFWGVTFYPPDEGLAIHVATNTHRILTAPKRAIAERTIFLLEREDPFETVLKEKDRRIFGIQG
jgi:hypothetical protein